MSKPEAADAHLGSPDTLDPTAVVTGDEPLLRAAGIYGLSKPTDPNYQGPNSQVVVNVDVKQPISSTDPKRHAFLVTDMDTVRVISSRERRWRTRSSVLQSQAKTFYENIVLGILRNVMVSCVEFIVVFCFHFNNYCLIRFSSKKTRRSQWIVMTPMGPCLGQ